MKDDEKNALIEHRIARATDTINKWVVADIEVYGEIDQVIA